MNGDVARVDRMERRLSGLERELRLWRTIAALVLAGVVGMSCDAPAEELSALDFVDGSRHVHLDAHGLRVEAGDRSATYSEQVVNLSNGALGSTLASDGLSIDGGDGAIAAVHVGSIWVSSGTGRAALSVEGGNTGIVEATAEHAVARLGATSGEASMELHGPAQPALTALAQSSAASVSVFGAGGAAHVYGVE